MLNKISQGFCAIKFALNLRFNFYFHKRGQMKSLWSLKTSSLSSTDGILGLFTSNVPSAWKSINMVSTEATTKAFTA